MRTAGWILLAALIRTAVLVFVLVMLYVGHRSQPAQLDMPRTTPEPSTSPTAPVLMERRAAAH